jgi:hypothetical protein
MRNPDPGNANIGNLAAIASKSLTMFARRSESHSGRPKECDEWIIEFRGRFPLSMSLRYTDF